MKRVFILFILVIFTTTNIVAQSIEGTWGGELKPIPSVTLKLFFNIKKINESYTATLDVPQQNGKDIPISDVTFANNSLSLKINIIGASFEGQFSPQSNEITGTFTQNGASFPLTLQPSEIKKVNRPQTPKPPFEYETEDVKFQNKTEGFTLAGTLTYPRGKKKLAAIVMLTGSGLQNRDEEIFEHKPFWVIADHLSRRGIAVLRFDDRGFAQSEGDPTTATTHTLATDAQAAIDFLKTRPEIDSKKIGLIGHSEGGNVAFITAAQNPKDVAFIVSMASMGETGVQTLIRQNEILSKARETSQEIWQKQRLAIESEYALLMEEKTIDQIKADARIDALNKMPEEMRMNQETLQKVEASIDAQITPWLINFLKYNPATDIAKVKCPVLILNGENDIQVEAKANTLIISNTLLEAGNKKIEVKIYPTLNHLFQTSKTGMIDEYGQIEETIAPQVLDEMAQWIAKTAKIK